ncbi:AAA family ATPase [Roseomonas frigidaquae]|uniref:DNA 5'-3' helicase n=1 Tax=Falsiroseomonas frigidaquae TaxID=487318 RepID=A0ABX1EVW2_9PROT|nr:DnaB-like helicase C-terminal domain-containing protein [Falsiroseomonas frigidaquae]NKE43400.1 AAA family ATPase [Falsiroseomonas frigidaquae]
MTADAPDPLFGISERQPPANLAAEQSLLGAIMANAKVYDRVAEIVAPEHFADPVHAAIFAAIQRRCEAGGIADAVTLRAEFENSGVLDPVGGADYLRQLLVAMVGIINAPDYARVIRDTWLRRQIINAAAQAIDRAYGSTDSDMKAEAVLEAVDGDMLRLASSGSADTARPGHIVGDSLMRQVEAAVDRRGALAGVTWGFRGLDRMTGGMRPGQLILLGARPSMGKTSLALRISLSAAGAGHRVLFISAEMKAEAVMARAVAAEARVPLSVLTSGGLVDPEDGRWRALERGAPEIDAVAMAGAGIGRLPIVWDDGVFTVPGIRARARRMQREPGGLGLIVVDYLGRLRASTLAMRQSNAAMASVSEISAGLKDLAMQLGVPVLLLSQLNRQVEAREDKTPQLSDLRDSGALEQDADVVAFLIRQHYYLTRNEPRRRSNEKAADFEERVRLWEADVAREDGRGTIIVAKQRQGPIGPVRVRFNDATAEFTDERPGEGGAD